jgi:hypothetical protein
MSAVRTSELPANVVGPPVPEWGEERFFDRRQVDEACAWALAGGVAIHGDVHREGPTFRVLGQLTVLMVWGRNHGLDQRSLRARNRRFPPHFEVSGALARQLARRGVPADAAKQWKERGR